MRYEHTPRPEVEHHYHIKDLIERQERRVYDRNYHREKAKNLDDRESTIRDALVLTRTDFACPTCGQEFQSQAVKQIEYDWSANQRIAFYKTKCFNGHWCIRLITDKYKDGFWARSKRLARDRGTYFNDTVQPGDTNYQLLYGKKNA